MKRILMIGAGLLAAAPIAMAAAGPAMAAAGPAVLGQVSGPYTIRYYSQYLTDPYAGGNGSTVRFYSTADPEGATWDVNVIGSVKTLHPFSTSSLNSQYSTDNVYEFENTSTGDAYSLGTDEDTAVMRPTSDGNYFVAIPEANTTYKLISVYASDNFGGGDIAYCLTYFASGQQAQYVSCDSSDQILGFYNA